MMGFSVLMSVYGKEQPRYLRKSLESVFQQSLKPDEVVLVEDGPLTEELYSVLDEFEGRDELKRVALAENGGLGRALNEGLKHCSYNLVVRMDTDDICFPDRFERQILFMEAHPEIAASSGWIEEFEGEIDHPVSVKRVPETPEEIASYGKSRNPLNHPAVIFRKEAVEAVGGYRHFPLFEDWYLWARLMANHYKLANLQTPILHFRTSPDMFKRRGGIKYAIDSFKFQMTLHRLGLISNAQAIKAGVMRGAVYVMPNFMRRLVYKTILRN